MSAEERERRPSHARPSTEIGLSLPLGEPGLAGARIHLTIEFPDGQDPAIAAQSAGVGDDAARAPSTDSPTYAPVRVRRTDNIPQTEYGAWGRDAGAEPDGADVSPVRPVPVPVPEPEAHEHPGTTDLPVPDPPVTAMAPPAPAAPAELPASVSVVSPAPSEPAELPAPISAESVAERAAGDQTALVPGIVEADAPGTAHAASQTPEAALPGDHAPPARPRRRASFTRGRATHPHAPRPGVGAPEAAIVATGPATATAATPASALAPVAENTAAATELTAAPAAPSAAPVISTAATATAIRDPEPADPSANSSGSVAAPAVVGAPLSSAARSPWYFPALGGIRGLIVLGVMLFHSGLVGQGLFVAVDLFFIVSGFVIVLQLLRRMDTTGTVSARTFLVRRIKRIMPALLITLALTMLITWRFGSLQESQSAGTLGLWSLAQAANWYEIVSGDAYWSMTGVVQPLAHMWSLSILEQFYLVWPAFMIGLWWLSRKKLVVMAAIIGVLCVASAFIAPMLWNGENADRLYLGTDTRLVAVLAGALGGAIVYIVLRTRISAPLPGGRLWPSVAGIAAIAGLMIGAAFGSDYRDPWLYQGGFAVAAVCGGVLTASLAFRGNVLSRIVGWSPFQVLGRVSYEMYLLHLPVFWIIQKLTPGISPLALFIAGAITTWVLGAILHFAFTEPWRLAPWTWKRGIPIFLVGVLTVVALGCGLPRLREAEMGDSARTDGAALPVEPGAAGGRPIVLTVGDSISRDFATALSDYGSHAFAVVDAGIGGCGLMSPDKVRAASGYVFAQQTQCGSWSDSVSEALTKNAPDIVLVHSAWDAADQHVDGKWLTSCDAEYRTRYLAELGTLLDLVETRAPGAQVVFSNDRTTSTVIDDPRVMTCYGNILAEVVKSRPGVHLLDLGGHLCPGERCLTETPEGSPIFLRDDLHFTEGGLTWLAPWLEQELAAVQRDARAAKQTDVAGRSGPDG